MPLVKRQIPAALSLAAPEIYEKSQGAQVLEDVNLAGLVGTLSQLGALAMYAHEMFSELFTIADGLAVRVVEVSSRASALAQNLAQAEEITSFAIGSGIGIDDNAVVEGMKLERQEGAQEEAAAAQKVFLPESMPLCLVERYHSDEVRKMPALSEIDALLSPEERLKLRQDRGVDSCARLYSNPSFFYQEFFRLEMERLDKVAAEKKQRKEERRARKKKKEAAAAGGASGELASEANAASRLDSTSGARAKRQLDFKSRPGGNLAQLRRASMSHLSAAGGQVLGGLVSKDTLVVEQGDAGYDERFYRREEELAGPSYEMPANVPTPPPRVVTAMTNPFEAPPPLPGREASFRPPTHAVSPPLPPLPASQQAAPQQPSTPEEQQRQQQQQQFVAPLPPPPRPPPPPPPASAALAAAAVAQRAAAAAAAAAGESTTGGSMRPPRPPPPPTLPRPPPPAHVAPPPMLPPQPPPPPAIVTATPQTPLPPPPPPPQTPPAAAVTLSTPEGSPPPPPMPSPQPRPPPPPPVPATLPGALPPRPPPPPLPPAVPQSLPPPLPPPAERRQASEEEEVEYRPAVSPPPLPPPPLPQAAGSPHALPVPPPPPLPPAVSPGLPRAVPPPPPPMPAMPPPPPTGYTGAGSIPPPPPLPPGAGAGIPLPPPLPPAGALGVPPPPPMVMPPPPRPPAAAAAADEPATGALLAAIREGKKLRPASEAQASQAPLPAPAEGKGGLLSAIQAGAKLRKVEAAPAPAAVANPSLGAFANPGINDILARRKYLEAESEESDSDDDSDWEED